MSWVRVPPRPLPGEYNLADEIAEIADEVTSSGRGRFTSRSRPFLWRAVVADKAGGGLFWVTAEEELLIWGTEVGSWRMDVQRGL